MAVSTAGRAGKETPVAADVPATGAVPAEAAA